MQNHERLSLLHLLDLGNSRAGELSIPRSPPPQNSYLTRIHRKHTEEQLLYFQIYSEAVSVCTLHLKVFTVPWWYWRAFLHGLSTSSSELSPCHTSPLRCRRAASASSRRGWKAFLAAVCIWGTSCHSSGLICQCRIILRGEECYKKHPFGGPSFIYSIYYLRGCILPELHYIWPFCSPSDSVSHCLCPVAGTQKSCWTSPFAQGCFQGQ